MKKILILFLGLVIFFACNEKETKQETNQNVVPERKVIEAKWYVKDGEQINGPYTITELKKMNIKPDTQLRLDQTDLWVPANSLPDFFEARDAKGKTQTQEGIKK